MSVHIGRSWAGHHLEDACPCPLKEPCGLIDILNVDPRCPEHGFMAAKTIRQSHDSSACPGVPDGGD